LPCEGKQQQDVLGMNFLFVSVFSLKLPEEEENTGEAEILLNEPSSPSFKFKQPQPQISPTESVVP
jgi:hypothetical protein